MTPEQQEEFEKAVQQHIQIAVNAALANLPQQPPQPAVVPAVTVNAVAVKLPELDSGPKHVVQPGGGVGFAAPTSTPRIPSTTTC